MASCGNRAPAVTDLGRLLRRPRLFVQLVLLLCLLSSSAIAVDIRMRSADQDRTAIQWMGCLDLCTPAFWPAGTVPRHPELFFAAVDLRLTPFLGLALDGTPMPLAEAGQGETAR